MYIGGIDIGGTKVICAVADGNKKILSKVTFESQKDKPETFFQKCIDKLAECCDNINIEIKNYLHFQRKNVCSLQVNVKK